MFDLITLTSVASLAAVLLSVSQLVIKAVLGSIHLREKVDNVRVEYSDKRGKRIVLNTDMSDYRQVEKLIDLFTRESDAEDTNE